MKRLLGCGCEAVAAPDFRDGVVIFKSGGECHDAGQFVSSAQLASRLYGAERPLYDLVELWHAAIRKSPRLMLTDQAMLLALVDAVEAARAVDAMRDDAMPANWEAFVNAMARLHDALAPFAEETSPDGLGS